MIVLDFYIKLVGWIYKKVSTSILEYEVQFFEKKNHYDPVYRKFTRSHISIVYTSLFVQSNR